MIKFFDIISFDMSNMIMVPYSPGAATWIGSGIGVWSRVAVADSNSDFIRIYQSEGSSQAVMEISIHSCPVK